MPHAMARGSCVIRLALVALQVFFLGTNAVPSAFSTWLHGQRVPVPPTQKKLFKSKIESAPILPEGVKHELENFLDVEVAGGNCTGIVIGRTYAQDLRGAYKVRVVFEGVGLTCGIRLSRPHVAVEVTLADSTVVMDMGVRAFALSDGSSVPLGSIHMAACKADVKFTSRRFHPWSSTSPPEPEDVGTTNLPAHLKGIAGLKAWAIDRLVEGFTCDTLTSYIDHWGKGVLHRVAGAAESLVREPPAQPAATVPLVDWAAYPPMQFVAELLVGRIDKIMQTDSVQKMLRFGGRKAFARLGKATSLEMGDVDVHGVVTPHLPQINLGGSGSQLDVHASIKQIELSAAVDLKLYPIDTWMTAELTNTPVLAPPVSTSTPLLDKLNFTVSLKNLSFAMQMLSMVSQPALNKLEIDQWQQIDCLGSCITEAASPVNKPVRALDMNFEIQPGLLRAGAFGSLEDDVLKTLQEAAVLMLRDAGPALASLSRGGLNVMIDEFLRNHTSCPASTVYYGIPTAINFCFYSGIFFLLLGVATGCVLWAMPGLAQSDSDDSRGVLALNGRTFDRLDDEKVYSDSDDEDEQTCSTRALCCYPGVPRWLAVSYPFFIVATIFLFLFGDFSLGTTLEIVFTAHGKETVIGPVFSFSLVSVIKDSYAAKAYLFAGLAAGMSGLWPLMKLVLLLLCWVAPECCCRVGLRGAIVNFLDQYGKYSLVDIWLGVIGCASYNLHWEGKDASIKVRPVILDGFVVFIIATIFSLILGHVAAICHHFTSPHATLSSRTMSIGNSDGSGNESDGEGTCSCLRSAACTWFVIFSLLMLPVVVMVGATTDSFAMVVGGIAADMLTDPSDRITPFNTISLGQTVAEADPTAFSLRWIQGVVYFFTIFLPILLALVSILLVMVRVVWPRRDRLHSNLLIVCRILDAWSALDVFALAVFVSALEIHMFASYLILYDNIRFGCQFTLDQMDASCMECGSQLLPGFAMLALAGILTYVLPKLVFCWVESKKSHASSAMNPNYSDREFLPEYE